MPLIRQSVISGKITDDAGTAVERASVVALTFDAASGRCGQQPRSTTISNDLGEYRLANLKSGVYCVLVHRGDVVGGLLRVLYATPPSASLPEVPEEGYVSTYYPSSVSPAAASPIQVQEGSERRDVDIRFTKARVFRVRGQIIDSSSDRSQSSYKVAILPPGTQRGMLSMGDLGGQRLQDSRFEILGVLPGEHTIIAQCKSGDVITYTRENIYVGGDHVADIQLSIPQHVTVAGAIRVHSKDLIAQSEMKKSVSGMSVALIPAAGVAIGLIPEAVVQADGSFIFRNVVPDRFRIAPSKLPAGWYVKTVIADGQELPGPVISVVGGRRIEINLAKGTAEVIASVVDEQGKAVVGAVVALVPDDVGEARVDLFRIEVTDKDGRAHIRDVAPARYRLFSWDEIDRTYAMEPEFHRLFEDKANRIIVEENEQEAVQLRMISADGTVRP